MENVLGELQSKTGVIGSIIIGENGSTLAQSSDEPEKLGIELQQKLEKFFKLSHNNNPFDYIIFEGEKGKILVYNLSEKLLLIFVTRTANPLLIHSIVKKNFEKLVSKPAEKETAPSLKQIEIEKPKIIPEKETEKPTITLEELIKFTKPPEPEKTIPEKPVITPEPKPVEAVTKPEQLQPEKQKTTPETKKPKITLEGTLADIFKPTKQPQIKKTIEKPTKLEDTLADIFKPTKQPQTKKTIEKPTITLEELIKFTKPPEPEKTIPEKPTTKPEEPEAEKAKTQLKGEPHAAKPKLEEIGKAILNVNSSSFKSNFDLIVHLRKVYGDKRFLASRLLEYHGKELRVISREIKMSIEEIVDFVERDTAVFSIEFHR